MTDFYPTNCYKCLIRFVIPAEEIPKLARERTAYSCPCGHLQYFNDYGAKQAIEWLASTGYYANPTKQLLAALKTVPVPAPTLSDAEREKRLQAKIKDIDDFLARRGKYAPTKE